MTPTQGDIVKRLPAVLGSGGTVVVCLTGRGDRSPGRRFTLYDDLANRCFQPLAHVSGSSELDEGLDRCKALSRSRADVR